MFYGFNIETKQCIWSMDVKPSDMPDTVVIQTNDYYDITDIVLGEEGDGTPIILPREITTEELLQIEQNKREGELHKAKLKIDILTDVVEFSPSETSESELTAWRKYRAELYNMEFDALESVVWPESPEAK